jgi:hypothetical protein
MDIIETGSAYVNKMIKNLELMNIKLRNVISQVHGASGLNSIRAIIEGKRDPHELASLCHASIKKKKMDEVVKSLEGTYHESYIMLLKENLRLWDEHQQSVKNIEQQISILLEKLNEGNRHIKVTGKSKPARHHRPEIDGLHKTMVQMYGGVNLTSIKGINDSTMLRLLGEAGCDLSRFPTAKHFAGWAGLSPKNKQSGKMKKGLKTASNTTGLIFRQAAQSLMNSKDSAIGAFIRRVKGRKGSKVAIKAGARKLCIAVYNALIKGLDYVEQGAKKYAEQLQLRELRLLQKLAAKHNFQLIDYKAVI